MKVEELIDKAYLMGLEYLPKVVLAIITLFIGFWIIKRIVSFATSGFNRSGMDVTMSTFLSGLISIGFKVLLVISVASMFGINTTSFVAIFGALMVGVGMSLNGTIGHFSAGVMLMIFKPFRVGDLVKIGATSSIGIVESINAFNTTLKTQDNQRIIIANSNVTGNDITNVSGQGTVGVELTFGIGYEENIDKARKIILEVGESCPFILNDPPQKVVVADLADSSVNLSTRPFCKSEDYWNTKFYMQENVKKQFDAQDVGIPFPIIEVINKEGLIG